MSISKEYEHVFSPLQVGKITLKNRIQFSPMVCCLSSVTGEVTNEYVEFLEMQARTGAALVTIGATSVDDETGTDFHGELSITKDEDISGLARIVEAVHKHGAKLSVEMCHAGRGADPTLLRKPEAWAPTPFPTDHGCRYVKEMNQRDIDHVIHQYVDCSIRLKKAGFDMVMVHAAHGNLLAQFLSPYSNKRNDNYGGSFENRMRFPIEVLKAVRAAVGDDFPIEMRISGDEIVPEGMHIDETLEFLKIAQKYIDLVHISAGLIVEDNYSFYTLPPYYHPYEHNVKYAEAAKKVLDIPVTTVGSIKTIEQAEEIIASGKADVVALARQLMADPDTIKKAYRGESATTRPCLRCMEGCGRNVCAGTQVRCSVNPSVGQETKYRVITPAIKKKKVVVVGGGAAGMMATQTLVQRGHEVVLYEKSNTLGGHLNEICALPFKDDLRCYKDWDIKTTMESGAKIILGTAATKEIIEKENPVALFIAAGSKSLSLNILGINNDNVHDVISVDNGKVEVGGKVVICGGGLSGLECALALAMDNKKVSVVDMIPVENFGKDMFAFNRNMLLSLLKRYNVKLIGLSKIEKFTAEGIEVIDKNWKRSVIEADTIVTAFGMKSDKSVIDELGHIVAETYVVGDCDSVRGINNANNSAFNYAIEV